MPKFHFQVITSTNEELNPVISAPNEYEAFYVLIGVCKNDKVIPARITLVQTAEDVPDIPCYIDDDVIDYWHRF